MRHHHPVPLANSAKAAQPFGASLTVAAQTGLALVHQHLPHHFSILRQAGKSRLQRLRLVPHHGHVVRQVDGRGEFVGIFPLPYVLGRTDIGAVAHPRSGQALALQNRISAADGASGHAQAARQVALGRQLFAHRHLPIQNGLGQVLGDGLVLGLATIAQAGR